MEHTVLPETFLKNWIQEKVVYCGKKRRSTAQVHRAQRALRLTDNGARKCAAAGVQTPEVRRLVGATESRTHYQAQQAEPTPGVRRRSNWNSSPSAFMMSCTYRSYLCFFLTLFKLLFNSWRTLRGPFSAVSTPNFSSKYSFESS